MLKKVVKLTSVKVTQVKLSDNTMTINWRGER